MGRAIVEAIQATGKYEVKILSRKVGYGTHVTPESRVPGRPLTFVAFSGIPVDPP